VRTTRGLLVVLALGLVVAGCGTVGRVGSHGDPGQGQQLFVKNCGSCHTLAAAGTAGTIGPNLDEAFKYTRSQKFPQSTIEDVVRGQIAYASPPMPQKLVTGEDADSVARFVAGVAGKPGVSQGGKITATSGKDIFTAAGCVSCHTLKDAGSTGTIGPNLDQAKPPASLVVDRVTNGKSAMPSFKSKLTDAQIQAVAKYVSSVAGK
jgi:cbb3-type cytochrome c oxidase subunit III